jgi:hypothetical protein
MAEIHRLTRRAALTVLAAAAGVPALAGIRPAGTDLTELRAIAVAAARTPQPAGIGAAHAAGRSVASVEAALAARLDPARTREEWRAALVASGRRDLAARDMVETQALPVTRTEAQLLALGVLLRRAGGA